ncbi:MAG: hypothetical protein AAB606_04065 [Patescibacteria group bacterium]
MDAKRAASELRVAILPLGKISNWQITLTMNVLEQGFGVKTIIMPAVEVPRQFFNAERSQYQARQLLCFLFSHLPANAQRIMGIIDGNMEYNDTSTCAGYADFYIGTAIYSVSCLAKFQSNPTQNQIGSDALSYHLIVHEFGHTLGLRHCENTDCAMYIGDLMVTMCDDCQRWTDRELQVKPGSAEERFARAENLQTMGLTYAAAKTYKQAAAQAKNEPHYYYRLAVALAKCGQKKEAKKYILLSATLTNDFPKLYYLFALTCLRENPDKAKRLFAQAVAVAKDKKHTHRIIGNAYREIAHDVKQATHHYREYFQLGGDDQTIIDWYNSRLRGQAKSY